MSKLKKKPLPFPPRDWMPLKDALLRIMSITGSRDLALACLNRDLRSGQLGSALVPPDGKATMTPLKPSDWQQRTVQAPWNPEEGVGVEPYVAGHYFVRHVDLDKYYPTLTMTAARQSDDIRPPEHRRGPVTTHDWHSINGEIARHRIDTKTGRVAVPKHERTATRPSKRQSLLQEILEVILRRYYPQGVPATASTSAVQQKVAAAWKAECQARGRASTEPPSWDTINRKLGRGRR